MITAIKLGLVALVLFALAYAVETRAILTLESSDKSGARFMITCPSHLMKAQSCLATRTAASAVCHGDMLLLKRLSVAFWHSAY